MTIPCRALSKSICLTLLLATLLSGTATHAAPSDGQKFRDWTARCQTKKGADKPTCFVFQNLLLKKENKRLLHVAIGYLTESEQPVAFFTLPLGVSLPGGLSVTIDDGKPIRLRYERCDSTGCLAPLALTETLVNSLQGGRWARVAYFNAARREISVPVSLVGFTSGLKSLQ
jgi:invasion protein IalB